MKGRFFLIVGPSASGKTELVNALLRRVPFSTRLITSTTRSPRRGELHGKDYFFLSCEEFEGGITSGDFFEYAEVYGNYYGVSYTKLTEARAHYNVVFLIIDAQGALSVKNKLGSEAYAIFIHAGSFEDIQNRIKRIRTDISEHELQKRMETVQKELVLSKEFDAIVQNREGYFEETVERVLSLIT